MASTKQYVMTGHIDYDVDITVHGKIATEIYDTLQGAEDLFRTYRAEQYGGEEFTPKLIIPHPLSDICSFDPLGVLSAYYRAKGIERYRESLHNKGCYISDSINNLMRLGAGRKVMYNIRPVHMLKPDGSFEYKLSSPLPPNMVNNLLTSWQSWLRIWSEVGDADPKWAMMPNQRRRSVPQFVPRNNTVSSSDWPVPVVSCPSRVWVENASEVTGPTDDEVTVDGY